jgi:tetratricopeptide (TPR) repeat protein
MGCVLAARGDLDQAEAMLTSALEQRDAVLAEESEQVVSNLCALADIHAARREWHDAVSRLSEAMGVVETWIGQGTPQAVMVMTRLGRALTDSGQLAQARPLLEQALSLAAQRLGEDHPTTASCLHNLAHCLVEHDAANPAPTPPETAATPDSAPSAPNLLDLARSHTVQALEIRERALPSDHHDFADSRRLLDRINRAAGAIEDSPFVR